MTEGIKMKIDLVPEQLHDITVDTLKESFKDLYSKYRFTQLTRKPHGYFSWDSLEEELSELERIINCYKGVLEHYMIDCDILIEQVENCKQLEVWENECQEGVGND